MSKVCKQKKLNCKIEKKQLSIEQLNIQMVCCYLLWLWYFVLVLLLKKIPQISKIHSKISYILDILYIYMRCNLCFWKSIQIFPLELTTPKLCTVVTN